MSSTPRSAGRPLAMVDLDGTVLGSWPVGAGPVPSEAVVVDETTGGHRSIVGVAGRDGVRRLAAAGVLVPVTARDAQQLTRITGLWDVLPEWSVAACGAELLHHGRPDRRWQELVAELVAAVALRPEEVAELLGGGATGTRLRVAGGAVAVASFPTAAAAVVTASACRQLARAGWSVRRSGRKLYGLPSGVDKGRAVTSLAGALGAAIAVAAGDSSLDVELLERARLAVVPAGSALDHRRRRSLADALVVPADARRPGDGVVAAVERALANALPAAPLLASGGRTA